MQDALLAIAERALEEADAKCVFNAEQYWFKGFDPNSIPQVSDCGEFVTVLCCYLEHDWMTEMLTSSGTYDFQTGMVKLCHIRHWHGPLSE